MCIKRMLRIIIITYMLLLSTNTCFAESFDVQFELSNSYKTTSTIILTNNSIATKNNISLESNNSDMDANRSIDALKEIAGYTSEEDIYNLMTEDEMVGNVLGDLMNELRPYLKDVIDKDISQNTTFTSEEIMEIITKNPIKFLVAIYNYIIQSIKEIFNIAAENAIVVTE